MYLNGFDTSSLGLIVTDVAGWLDGLVRKDRTQELIGRAGLLLTHPRPTVMPRAVTVTGVVRRNTNALMRAALLELQERAYRGTVEVSFQDDQTKLLPSRCVQFTFAGRPPKLANPYGDLSVMFTGLDPYIYDAEAQVVSFGSGVPAIYPCPLGSAPSAPLIRIVGSGVGALVNPVISYLDARGNVVQTMGFTTNLGAQDYLEIDCHLMTIIQSRNTVVSNGMSLLTSGDFIVLDPQDGDYANNLWPMLSATPAQTFGVALYRKAWL